MTRRKIILVVLLEAAVVAAGAITAAALINADVGVELPVLMYHHLDDTGDDVVTISGELFEEQMKYLGENGYTTVSFDELVDYVSGDLKELPEKPVAIVFDDGYESNYKIAFPILQKYSCKAEICLIGSCVGKDTYKDTGVPMLPYLTWDEAKEMYDSGLVGFGSHTYDMHQYAPFESGTARESVQPLPGESEVDFVEAIRADHNKLSALIKEKLGCEVSVFAYPNGKYTPLAEKLIRSLGVKATLTTRVGMNHIRCGDPESLYLLRRYSINETTDLETFQSYLDGKIP